MQTNPAFIAAIAVGALMLMSVCFVYVRYRELKVGGIVLSGLGVVLLGMSVWKSIDVSFGKDGIKSKLEQIQAETQEVKKTAEAAQQSSTQVRETVSDIQGRLDLAAAQAQLSSIRLYNGAPDGNKGKATEMALRTFQASQGIPITGNLDARTKQELERAATATAIQ